MFYSIQLAFRRVPASLAVATLIVCTFWGIASGLVGAVVVLMGVIAFNPMLKAGYDVRLASGVITAGGTLGILIPPSVMIIVYAAVAGQSVVKLYASAMFPGFFLSFLYLVYIIGWALINPKIAPPLPEAEQRVPVPQWIPKFQQAYSNNMLLGLIKALFAPAKARSIEMERGRMTYGTVWKNFIAALFPLVLSAITLWGIWWYVVIHQQADARALAEVTAGIRKQAPAAAPAAPAKTAAEEDKPQEMGTASTESTEESKESEGIQEMGDPELAKQQKAAPADAGSAARVLQVVLGDRRGDGRAARLVLLDAAGRAVRAAEAADFLGHAAGHPHHRGPCRDPVRHHHRHRVCGHRRRGGFPARAAGPHAGLGAHQAVGIPDGQDHCHGVLAVRRFGAVLGGCSPSWAVSSWWKPGC